MKRVSPGRETTVSSPWWAAPSEARMVLATAECSISYTATAETVRSQRATASDCGAVRP